MTPVYREIINHPAAWTARSLPRGKEDLVRALSEQELAGFDALLAKTRGKPIQDVTREDFDEPGVTALLRDVRDVIEIGRGAIILRGVTPERYSPEDMGRIYWGVGTHLGVANVQSAAGDRLGYVEEDETNAVKRGYRSSGELHWHTDSPETIGLMCIRTAASGGMSGIVSTLAIHNEIFHARPDLLDSLYEGYYYAIPELKFTDKAITDEKIPVFSNYDGVVELHDRDELHARGGETAQRDARQTRRGARPLHADRRSGRHSAALHAGARRNDAVEQLSLPALPDGVRELPDAEAAAAAPLARRLPAAPGGAGHARADRRVQMGLSRSSQARPGLKPAKNFCRRPALSARLRLTKRRALPTKNMGG